MKMFLAIQIWDHQLTPSNLPRLLPHLPEMTLIGSNRLCAVTPLREHPYRLRTASKPPTKAENSHSLAVKATRMKSGCGERSKPFYVAVKTESAQDVKA
jgi:hypothetical protein